MGLSGHVSTGPLRVHVKVDVCCDPFFVNTLTCVKIIETIVESV
jgi:hypothetical protein